MTAQPRAPFVIGTDVWPGIAKLMEEAAEVVQVCAKLMAFPDGNHPDGQGDLHTRLAEELADVFGAGRFVMEENADRLDAAFIEQRAADKLALFHRWHDIPKAWPPAPTCTYCGKDEQDGVGIIVGGACPDCTRAWS